MIPPYLKSGDKVAIVATARKISREEIQPAIAILESYGLFVETGVHLFSEDHQFSGTDEQRAHDLQQAFSREDIKAIIVARGGYGTVRIIDQIDFSSLKQFPKWIVGYSDITVLHSALANLNMASIHGTMPINFTKNKEATESLKNLLFGEANTYTIPPHPFNKIGEIEGEIIGGNLSLLYSLASTPSDISTNGKILFLEDLDEYLYHIDRMMMQLKRSGKLSHLKGLIIGGMSDMKDNTIPFGKNAEEIIADTIKEYHYPVCFNFPAGHIDRNLAIYFGKKAKLSVNHDGVTLNYL